MKEIIHQLALYYVQIKVNLWLNIHYLKMKHRFLLRNINYIYRAKRNYCEN